jgi:hypothetical protein
VAQPARHTCRLTFTIDGVDYAVRRPPGDRSPAPRRWSLHREDGARYHISQSATGVECDCPAFTFRRGPASCKHVRAMIATGLIEFPGK